MDEKLMKATGSEETEPVQKFKYNSLAITSMILSICSVLLALLPLAGLMGFVLALLSVLFASISKKQIQKSHSMQKGTAIANAGLIIGIIAAFLSAAAQAFFFALFHFFTKFMELSHIIP